MERKNNHAAEALINTGVNVIPGDRVIVKTEALRMWGARVRADVGATEIEVEATVLSLNFERDENTNELVWKGEAAASVPVKGSERTFWRTIPIHAGNICRICD